MLLESKNGAARAQRGMRMKQLTHSLKASTQNGANTNQNATSPLPRLTHRITSGLLPSTRLPQAVAPESQNFTS